MDESINKKGVGKRIHDLRIENYLSMDELSKLINVSGKSTINNWENGSSIPKQDNLRKISKYFNVNPKYILYGSLKDYVINLINQSFFNFQTKDKNDISKLFEDNVSEKTVMDVYLNKELYKAICYYDYAKNYKSNDKKMNKDQVDAVILDNIDNIIDELNSNNIDYGKENLIIEISTKVINEDANNINNVVTLIHKIDDKINDINRLMKSSNNASSLKIDVDNFTISDFIDAYKEKNKNKVTYKQLINAYYQLKTASSINKLENDLFNISVEYSRMSYKYKDNLDNQI